MQKEPIPKIRVIEVFEDRDRILWKVPAVLALSPLEHGPWEKSLDGSVYDRPTDWTLQSEEILNDGLEIGAKYLACPMVSAVARPICHDCIKQAGASGTILQQRKCPRELHQACAYKSSKFVDWKGLERSLSRDVDADEREVGICVKGEVSRSRKGSEVPGKPGRI